MSAPQAAGSGAVGARLPEPFDTRLQLFTGKGGVGKSTVVAALALEAARRGGRPLIVELGHRASMQSVLGIGGIGPEPHPASHGVWAVNVDFDSALAEYVTTSLPFGGIAQLVLDNAALARFFHAAPAVGEVVTLERLRRLLAQKDPETGEPRFDPLLVDLDATGHALMLLELPRVLDGLVGHGRLRKALSRLDALLSDSALTRLNLVTLPAELPVQETVELYDELEASHSVPLGGLVVNRIPAPPLSAAARAQLDQLEPAELTEPEADDVALAQRALLRQALVVEQLERLRQTVPLPIAELPDLGAGRLGLALLAELGQQIAVEAAR